VSGSIHPLRRSVLYVPATNAKAMAKAWSLGADSIVFDLEDAVAPGAKAAAREALVARLGEAGRPNVETVVRVNAVGAEGFAADLDAVARARPDAVLLPKVDGAACLDAFAEAAARAKLPAQTRLWAMVETAAGLLDLDRIVGAGRASTHGLACLVVGTNDIAKETGVFPGDQRAYLLPWLMNVVLVAKRHRITVLDGVWNDFRDERGFEAQATQAMKMAFDGKTLIHPTQVAPANRIFSPSPQAVADALRIVEAFADPRHAGANVINLDGRMVERLHLEQAQRLIAADARARGAPEDG
jgi:citrate lyase subunit beta/citryl-CoA lyase